MAIRDKTATEARRFRWLRNLALAAIVVAVVVAVLPIGIKVALQSWLVDRGADQASIEDIDLNLFTGAASIKGIDIRLGDRTVIGNTDVRINIS